MIEKIEAHSFLSMPSSHEETYDGWLLRSADGRTKRFNSVNFPSRANGNIPILQKIQYCEQFYAAKNMPCRFRITPLATPSDLESRLQNREFLRIDRTDVCVRTLLDFPRTQNNPDVIITDNLTEEWVDKLCELTNRDADQRDAFLQMQARLKINHLLASIVRNGEIVSVGFATVHGGIIGLFEFATDPNFRRQGLGKLIVNTLLARAKHQGIEHAYLQVVQENQVAREFWYSMGFTKVEYEYSYLCKDMAD